MKHARGLLVAFVAVVLVLLLLLYYGALAIRDSRLRVHIRQRAVEASRNGILTINDELAGCELDELAASIANLNVSEPIELRLSYIHGTDDLLQKLSQQPCIRSLYLEGCDITDGGMKYISTMPSLESLTLYDVKTGDVGLQWIASNNALSALLFRSYTPVDVEEILAIPHLAI